MRKALGILEEQGLLTSVPRKGYYVSADGLERKKLIAAIVENVAKSTWAAAIRGIEDVAQAERYNLIVASHETDLLKHKTIINRLVEQQVAGFILVPSAIQGLSQGNDIILEAISRSGAKAVFLDRALRGSSFRIRSVGSDNVSGSFRLTSHLIRQGHKRILFVQSSSRSAVQERWLGYRLALSECGLPYDESLVVTLADSDSGETLSEEGTRHLERILRSLRYTAVFAANDNIGAAVFSELSRMKRRVPKDVSVASYDARELSAVVNAKITGINQPFYEMGRLCANLLLREISGTVADGVISYVCASEFQQGDSVAPLSKR